MRIAHIVSTFTPRQSTLLEDAIARTQARGLRPEVITLEHEGVAPSAPTRRASQAPGWRLDGLAERWLDVSLGRKWHGAPRGRERALERSLRAAYPDVIHAHHGPNAFLAADIALQMDVPLVVSLYPQDLEAMRRHTDGRRYAKLWGRAAGLIVPTTFQREALVGAGADPACVRVAPAGLDLGAYDVRPRTGPLERMLCVGSCVARRGFDDILSAMSRLRGAARLQVLGDGPLMPALGRQARELGVAVQFAPILSLGSIVEALSEADVLVCADRTVNAAPGALPRVILQAHAMGVPCVATDHAGAREAFPSKDWLVPERAPRLMAEALTRLRGLSDGALETLARENRAHVERVFDVERSVDVVVGLYEEVR